MARPTLELLPLLPAVPAGVPGTLDVLIRVTPPLLEARIDRPGINLGLVLDRSGSMAEARKIEYARAAAIYAVQQLLPSDRVSVTIFDDRVETIVPNTVAADKAGIVARLEAVRPGDRTALHAGWSEGGDQVRRHLLADGINRVLLLSDGQANLGQTNPDVIATDVNKLARQGVSTTTMGVGDDYNEVLLQSMAQSGDGNYYYIASPVQLADLFQTELHGLMATAGTRVSLGLEPAPGVTVADVFNDLEMTEFGRLKLSNLIVGMPLEVVARLNLPVLTQPTEVCRFRLAWQEPDNPQRQTLTVGLTLPAVTAAEWHGLKANALVQEHVVLLQMARLKKVATDCVARGDREAARRALAEARQLLATLPASSETRQEDQSLARIERHLEEGDREKFGKQARFDHYVRTQSRPMM